MPRSPSPTRRRPLAPLVLLVVLAAGAGPVRGAETASASETTGMRVGVDRPAHGQSVARLLELQRSGRLATPRPQTLSGEVQSRVYRRYLESFTHPIPDDYIDLEFAE